MHAAQQQVARSGGGVLQGEGVQRGSDELLHVLGGRPLQLGGVALERGVLFLRPIGGSIAPRGARAGHGA